MRSAYTTLALLAFFGACTPDSVSAGDIPDDTGSTSVPLVPPLQTSGMGACDAEAYAYDWNHTCTENSDCVTVFEGRSDDGCRMCAFGAINVDDEAEYTQTLGPLSCGQGECDRPCVGQPGVPATCADGECTIDPPPWPITCGDKVCNQSWQLCLLLGSDTPDEPGTYSCVEKPEQCRPPVSFECDCLGAPEGEPFDFEFCESQASCMTGFPDQGLQVTCPNG